MNKIFYVALPVIALLSLGTYYVANHGAELKEYNVTIYDWTACTNGAHIPQCKDLVDQEELAKCNNAATIVNTLTSADQKTPTKECVAYHKFISDAQTHELLNTKNYFQDCFLTQQVVSNAQLSPFYFNSIFAPQYVTCAGF